MKKKITRLVVSEFGISFFRGNDDDSIVNHYSPTKKNYRRISDIAYEMSYYDRSKIYPTMRYLGYRMEIS
jgi:hypothetical protein